MFPETTGNFPMRTNTIYGLGKLLNTWLPKLKVLTSDNSISDQKTTYKVAHSTETALLRVQSDILNAIDKQESVLLLLLDLSAASDTVDHVILLSRLNARYGIKGNVPIGLRPI